MLRDITPQRDCATEDHIGFRQSMNAPDDILFGLQGVYSRSIAVRMVLDTVIRLNYHAGDPLRLGFEFDHGSETFRAKGPSAVADHIACTLTNMR